MGGRVLYAMTLISMTVFRLRKEYWVALRDFGIWREGMREMRLGLQIDST